MSGEKSTLQVFAERCGTTDDVGMTYRGESIRSDRERDINLGVNAATPTGIPHDNTEYKQSERQGWCLNCQQHITQTAAKAGAPVNDSEEYGHKTTCRYHIHNGDSFAGTVGPQEGDE
jgi:nitrate reductase cytochrome c-type subunit